MEELFWADQLARQIVARTKTEKRIANIKCQQTPSGGKHIGNINDVIRAYFPYKALLEMGEKCTFVHTTDDRDPLKDIPYKLADLKGNWHLAKDLMDMKPYLGKPLCRIPDPFSCCKSWSVHFTKVWMDGVYALGMRPELHSVDELYKQGKLEPYIRMVFEKADTAGKIAAKYQQTKTEKYIPFDAICPKCGTLSNIDSFDLKKKTVHFICGGKSIKQKRAEGCGEESEVPWSEGKLQWRFEWPALWGIFNTTFEPMGKDHWEGSWKSGVDVARQIFGIEPPIPYVYEFFLVNGEKMSASKGNVYIVQDMLKIMEPEVFMYFYTKRPTRQRDIELKEIFKLADEFDKLEEQFFSIDSITDAREKVNIQRSYFFSMKEIPKKKPLRIPFAFASTIAQTVSSGKALADSIEILKSTGHIEGKLSSDEQKQIEERLKAAKFWVENYAPEEYRIEVVEEPSKEILSRLSSGQKKAMKLLASELNKKLTEKQLYEKFFEISEKSGIDAKELFAAAYLVILGKERGPRLAPFIMALGKEKVAKILEKV